MTKVSTREFFRNPYKYLELLPVTITKRGIPKYIISQYGIDVHVDGFLDVVTKVTDSDDCRDINVVTSIEDRVAESKAKNGFVLAEDLMEPKVYDLPPEGGECMFCGEFTNDNKKVGNGRMNYCCNECKAQREGEMV